MPIGIGPDQLGRDLRAIDRRGQSPEGVIEGGNVEPPEMKKLRDRRVGQKGGEVRGLGLAGCDLDQMGVAVAGRQLHQAQTVPMRVQPHGLAIDGDRVAPLDSVRQIALVEVVRHSTPRVLKNR